MIGQNTVLACLINTIKIVLAVMSLGYAKSPGTAKQQQTANIASIDLLALFPLVRELEL